MRWVATILIIILFCAFAVSFTHSMDLFESYGFHDRIPIPILGFHVPLSVVATVMVELVFLTASGIIIYTKLNGQKLRFSTIFGFIYGVLMVGWANISSTSVYGIGGWLIGASIPLGVFLVEGMFMDVVFGDKVKKQIEEQVDISNVNIQKVDTTKVDTSKVDTTKVDIKVDMVKVDTDKVDKANLDTKVDTSKVDTKTSKVDIFEVDMSKVDKKVDMSNMDMKVDTSKTSKVDENVKTSSMDMSKVDTKVDTKVLDISKLLENRKRKNSDTVKEIERVVKYGLDIKAQEGDIPGRKRLMNETGCSEYIAKEAKKVLDELSHTG